MKAVVDRIEHNLAVLLLKPDENIQFSLPSEILPEIVEGDIIDIVITKDENATHDSWVRSIDLIEKLKIR